MGGRLDPAVAEVRTAVRESLADVDPGQHVLVACSGGADSMALASAAVWEGRHAGWLVGAVVVDHQLQPDSAQVSADVAARLTAMGCDRVDVIAVQVDTVGGPEAAARDARYTALERLGASTNAVILLGHSRDDQAETVLLGLARGSGLRSLAGMAPRRGRLRRPLLGLPRSVLRRACEAQQLTVWDDPHNLDDRFSRVRVRHQVLPVLEQQLGPGVSEALARTAELARADADALDELALHLAGEATTAPGTLSVARLVAAPAALRHRVLRTKAVAAGCAPSDLTAGHTQAVDRLLMHWHGQTRVDLPGKVQARRRDGLLMFEKPDVAG